MARVLVCEPVEETRILIENLVQRMGHEVVAVESFGAVDVVFYEPGSVAGLALARRVQGRNPEVALVAVAARPPREPLTSPRPAASILQPFCSGDIRRVLEMVLAGTVPACSTS